MLTLLSERGIASYQKSKKPQPYICNIGYQTVIYKSLRLVRNIKVDINQHKYQT